MHMAVRPTERSRMARKRRRGETDEEYQKRMAALDANNERQRRFKARAKSAPAQTEPASIENVEAKVSDLRQVAERALELDAAERKATELAVMELRAQLDRERRERELLRRQYELRLKALTARKDLEAHEQAAKSQIRVKAVEIIEDLGEPNKPEAVHEIIEDFVADNSDSDGSVTEGAKLMKSNELYDEANDGNRTSSIYPLKGYMLEATSRPVFASFVIDGREAEEKKSDSHPPSEPACEVVLSDAADRMLLVGWLDRARSSQPRGRLLVTFGARERRIWRDVVAEFAQAAGCDDLTARSSEIPFAYHLVWALRWALHALPAGCSIPELSWRTLSSFMRPQRRVDLGALAGMDSAAGVLKRFEAVEREIEAGTLIVVGGEHE